MNLSQILKDELERRKQQDPRYSLRTFAQDLNVNRTTLNFVINKKRNLSKSLALRVIEKLNIPELLAHELLAKRVQKEPAYKTIDLETFERISNWYHQGIIGLADLQKNKADSEWIAKRLGIEKTEAQLALNRLIEAGVIKVVGQKMKQTNYNIATPTDIASSVLKQYHKENMKLAAASLDEDPLDLRDMTAISFAVDKKSIIEIKAVIKKFQRSLCKKFENKKGNEVYTLATQLFPLTIREK